MPETLATILAPALLASPEDDFNGWLYSTQPTVTHGHQDLVLGWHMSAEEAILTYFQFNGSIITAEGGDE